jgi:SAM-dependent methyltransferase
MTDTGGLFHKAITEYNEPNRGHPQYEVWLNYALSTNQRGQYVIHTLKGIIPSLKGRRYLDIGCGYGGACLAAAEAGAEVIGIDIDDSLLTFAEMNNQDHPNLHPSFYLMDVMAREKIQALGQFDVITCDNVIEHVAIPERLIAHLRLLLTTRGFAYVTIPNAFSVGQVLADCHYGLFGISLLDPWDAETYVRNALGQPSYDVSFYYSYAHYGALFDKYGMPPRLWNSLQVKDKVLDGLKAQAAGLPAQLLTAREAGQFPPEIGEKLAGLLDVYLQELETGFDLYQQLTPGAEKKRLGERLWRDYGEEVWYVVAARNWRALRSLSPTLLARKTFRRARTWLKGSR